MAEVCVLGAGPAGCVFAARMAQLGHDVHVIEREPFPRRRLGESLSPGVMPMLRSADLHEEVEAAAFPRIRAVWVKWGAPPRWREDPREQGLLVDRGDFDLRLLTRARSLGVRVHQPARVLDCALDGSKWRIRFEAPGGLAALNVDFLADARGRRGADGPRQSRTGAPTLAVYAYWRGRGLPRTPRIEAGREAWYWGVPLPDGLYNTLVFIDPKRFRSAAGSSASQRFLELLDRSSLLENRGAFELVGSVRAIDATPRLVRECATPRAIRVGDAALSIDPISSSGVQKAIQSALSGAIVANTLIRKPEWSETAVNFHHTQLAETSERHRRWAAGHYRTVAVQNDRPFWADRSAPSALAAPSPKRALDASAIATLPVELSQELDFVRMPRLEGDFVNLGWALSHPRLASPVVYLDGWELAPLVRRALPGRTPLQIAQSWSDQVPIQTGLAIVAWLFNKGLLVAPANQGELR
jgi:flavin-dependent dehydrogenase